MIAGIDYSTRAVDVVLLDEDTDAATWHRFEIEGTDAFDRARRLRTAMPSQMFWDDHGVIAVGIEDPRGYNAGALYRMQGAILGRLPGMTLVQPFPPSVWRKTVGLPGNASKDAVRQWAQNQPGWGYNRREWPQDACDAYCIALATRTLIQYGEAVA